MVVKKFIALGLSAAGTISGLAAAGRMVAGVFVLAPSALYFENDMYSIIVNGFDDLKSRILK